jgi:transposase-like protein
MDGTLQQEVQDSVTVDAELKRFREENRQLKMERDILKKATVFFAKENS